jgi:hypothetical protein
MNNGRLGDSSESNTWHSQNRKTSKTTRVYSDVGILSETTVKLTACPPLENRRTDSYR